MEELTVTAEVNNLEQVRTFATAPLVSEDCPMKVQLLVEMAIEEIFVNIANYAYPDSIGQAVIRTELLQKPRRISITFVDSGIPFDPLKKKIRILLFPLMIGPSVGWGFFW